MAQVHVQLVWLVARWGPLVGRWKRQVLGQLVGQCHQFLLIEPNQTT